MTSQDWRREQISRTIDVLIAGLALVCLSPVMLLIAAAIIVESGLPVFFFQKRLGLGGKPFLIYKFRKFHNCDDGSGPLLTVRNDPRMSSLGRLLERTKLDELPQFYNVLKGDMAIVGPRPDTSVAFDRLTREYRTILDYKPGIFGPAQIAFRNAGALYPQGVDRHAFYRDRILPVKATLDLEYYPRRTLPRDLVWIVRGILAVIGLHPTLNQLPATPIVLSARTSLRARSDDARSLVAGAGSRRLHTGAG